MSRPIARKARPRWSSTKSTCTHICTRASAMDNNPLAPPAWFQSLAEKYQAGIGHGFVLHLNINDLVTPGVTIRSYLNAALGSSAPVVAWYDRAQGISFPLPSMRPRFLQA